MSEIDDEAKAVLKKADRFIALNLVKIALFVLRYGTAFVLGAYLF